MLESEPIQHAPQMQEVVNNMQAAAAEVKVEAEQVTILYIFMAHKCVRDPTRALFYKEVWGT